MDNNIDFMVWIDVSPPPGGSTAPRREIPSPRRRAVRRFRMSLQPIEPLARVPRREHCAAVGHHAGGRAMARHPETAAIVDDDQIGAALLDERRADDCAGAGRDDRLALLEGRTQAFDDFLARVGISFSGPGIGHDARGLWGWLRLPTMRTTTPARPAGRAHVHATFSHIIASTRRVLPTIEGRR